MPRIKIREGATVQELRQALETMIDRLEELELLARNITSGLKALETKMKDR